MNMNESCLFFIMQDTKIGGLNTRFPSTRWSAIVAARSNDPAERRIGFEVLVAAYWKPVYKCIRIKWKKSNEDAKDLTQQFFTTAIDKDFFKKFNPAKAHFRTYIRTCLNGFVANEEKAARRIKRGGDKQILSLDFNHAERELTFRGTSDNSVSDYFDQEWIRNLFAMTIEELRESFKANGMIVHFKIFERYDLNESNVETTLTYEDLATEFNLPVSQVRNYLTKVRNKFRQILLTKLCEITLTEEEFRSEAQSILGIKVG